MSLPGLLIEYLITGAVGLLWIFVALGSRSANEIQKVELFLLPLAYILGMVIDVLAYGFTYWPKEWVRHLAFKSVYPTGGKDDEAELRARDSRIRTTIQTAHKELSNEINMRNSRDRIARGMIINSICVIIFLQSGYVVEKLLMLVVSIVCWIFFEYKSHKYFLLVQKRIKTT